MYRTNNSDFPSYTPIKCSPTLPSTIDVFRPWKVSVCVHVRSICYRCAFWHQRRCICMLKKQLNKSVCFRFYVHGLLNVRINRIPWEKRFTTSVTSFTDWWGACDRWVFPAGRFFFPKCKAENLWRLNQSRTECFTQTDQLFSSRNNGKSSVFCLNELQKWQSDKGGELRNIPSIFGFRSGLQNRLYNVSKLHTNFVIIKRSFWTIFWPI